MKSDSIPRVVKEKKGDHEETKKHAHSDRRPRVSSRHKTSKARQKVEEKTLHLQGDTATVKTEASSATFEPSVVSPLENLGIEDDVQLKRKQDSPTSKLSDVSEPDHGEDSSIDSEVKATPASSGKGKRLPKTRKHSSEMEVFSRQGTVDSGRKLRHRSPAETKARHFDTSKSDHLIDAISKDGKINESLPAVIRCREDTRDKLKRWKSTTAIFASEDYCCSPDVAVRRNRKSIASGEDILSFSLAGDELLGSQLSFSEIGCDFDSENNTEVELLELEDNSEGQNHDDADCVKLGFSLCDDSETRWKKGGNGSLPGKENSDDDEGSIDLVPNVDENDGDEEVSINQCLSSKKKDDSRNETSLTRSSITSCSVGVIEQIHNDSKCLQLSFSQTETDVPLPAGRNQRFLFSDETDDESAETSPSRQEPRRSSKQEPKEAATSSCSARINVAENGQAAAERLHPSSSQLNLKGVKDKIENSDSDSDEEDGSCLVTAFPQKTLRNPSCVEAVAVIEDDSVCMQLSFANLTFDHEDPSSNEDSSSDENSSSKNSSDESGPKFYIDRHSLNVPSSVEAFAMVEDDSVCMQLSFAKVASDRSDSSSNEDSSLSENSSHKSEANIRKDRHSISIPVSVDAVAVIEDDSICMQLSFAHPDSDNSSTNENSLSENSSQKSNAKDHKDRRSITMPPSVEAVAVIEDDSVCMQLNFANPDCHDNDNSSSSKSSHKLCANILSDNSSESDDENNNSINLLPSNLGHSFSDVHKRDPSYASNLRRSLQARQRRHVGVARHKSASYADLEAACTSHSFSCNSNVDADDKEAEKGLHRIHHHRGAARSGRVNSFVRHASHRDLEMSSSSVSSFSNKKTEEVEEKELSSNHHAESHTAARSVPRRNLSVKMERQQSTRRFGGRRGLARTKSTLKIHAGDSLPEDPIRHKIGRSKSGPDSYL